TGRSNVRTGHREVEERSTANPILLKERFRVVDLSRTGSAAPPDGTSEFFTGRTKTGLQFVYKTPGPHRRQGRRITDRMLFPRDPVASAGNVVNCACLIIDVVPDFDETVDRLIREFEEGG
ncbi:MAG: hypothetical protein V3R20_04515, partial [Sphingomonadales bacterium]